ncbi:MAG: four helix bundle protein [Gemmatimonadaceae bacterium]
MQDYRKLIAWQRAHALAVDVHRTARGGGRGGVPGLRAQILRSAAAIPANIAEGCGRRTNADLARFLDIALGSLVELDYHLLLARDVGLLARAAHARLETDVQEVRRLLIALLRRVRMRDAGVSDE